MVLKSIFFCLFPFLRKYRKIPKNLVFNELSHFYPNITRGRVIKVYDGDTITVAARVPELKNNKIYKFSIRLNRVDAPELRTTNAIEKEYAIKVRDLLSERIMNKMIRLKVLKSDKYGRYLCEIYYKKDNINDWLLNNNYAMTYNGGTKPDFDTRNYNPSLEEEIAVAVSIDYNRNPNNRVTVNARIPGDYIIE